VTVPHAGDAAFKFNLNFKFEAELNLKFTVRLTVVLVRRGRSAQAFSYTGNTASAHWQ
jgi:hypothetical protein